MPPEAMARSEPTSLANGDHRYRVSITRGIYSFSISLLIAAPQRVLEPQVDVRITPVTRAAFILGQQCHGPLLSGVSHRGVGAAGGVDELMQLYR